MVTITPEIRDLINLTVNSAVKAAIEQFRKMLPPEPTIKDEDFLSAEETAKFLKIKLSTLYSKVEKCCHPDTDSNREKELLGFFAVI